jgi:acetyl coenzyme A synthetase (ADP forming)-like protein
MLSYLFNPSSVAIIGASHTPGKIGHEILKNLIESGYKGKIYPVNPDVTPILNLKVYPSVKKIEESVDLAVIAVPAKIVGKVLKECVEKKVKAVIIISAGFSEIGEEGRKLEEGLKKIIEKKKIRVLGPNVVGVYDSFSKLDTLFLSRERLERPKEGNIAFISQSGAVGSTILDWLASEKIGISKFVSYGNAVDINEADLLDYLAEDEKTKVIVFYLEGIKSDGKRFIQTLKKATSKKPVLILKAGKTEKGKKAVLSHTGSLAGAAEIYSAAFKQAGAIEVNSWEELFDCAKAFSTQPLPKGNNLLIVTDGGGFGVLATDEAERQGINLKELPKDVERKLKKIFPSYAILSNPLDLTGDATVERYKEAINACIDHYDGVIAITLLQVPTLKEDIVYALAAIKAKVNKPILVCASGGKFTKNLSEKLEAFGIPVYPTPERAVRAFSALVKYSRFVTTFK